MIPSRGARRSAVRAAVLLLAACADRPPPPPEFNENRAWAHLGQQVAFGPRYAGNRGHERQVEWLLHELRFRADTVLQQKFTATGEEGRTLQLSNVLARFRPEAAERVLLVANLDTRRRAGGSPDPLDRRFPVPGANVNASGVAVLLEMAQLFKEQPPPVGVDLLFSDGDDYSAGTRLEGARRFVREMPGYRPRYAVVLQGVADLDARFPVDSASAASAPEPTRRIWEAAKRLGYDTVFVAETAPALDGQGPVLAAAGIPAVVVADREYGPGNLRWHASDDLPRFLSKETLRLVGRTLAALVYGETPAEEG